MDSANVVTEILENAADAATGFGQVLGNGFNGVTSLFWANNAPTFLGALSLIGVGVGVIYFAFRLIKRLVSVKG